MIKLSLQFKTLYKKEVLRFTSVWGQTLITPVLSSFLYLFIFGYSLGKQISMGDKFSYLEFIIPGLIIMGIINNSYQNCSSSILVSKFHGNIYDILISPISYMETVAAFTAGGMTRGLIVGIITFIVSTFFKLLPVSSLPIIILISIFTSMIFSQIGIMAAIYSNSFDQISMITNYILMPLTYLSGIFYSINILPPFWRKLSYFNPLFYMVDSFRYGFLGISDVNPLFSIFITLIFAIMTNIITIYLLRSGYGLRK